MKCSDIPTKLISDTRLRLLAPVLDKAADMHRLIVYFSQPHTDFLAWANGSNRLEDARANMQTAVDNFKTVQGGATLRF
ncbi:MULTISPECIES: hypothetical protein [Pseudomonas]|uniref:hypothetical protein n=1 Tax=Pseudomonas TaxID=286 RepID=UPI0027338BD2|nr:hypothetical protein [Pseudomonas sp. FP597]WLI07204.1 hypothetical protein PSH66_02395 [Pseudomonas sp. FP597]